MTIGCMPHDPRRHVRFEVPGFDAQVAGLAAQSINWSWGGVALAVDPAEKGKWREGAPVHGTLRYGAALPAVPFEGEVRWVAADGASIGVSFAAVNRDLVNLVTDAVRDIASRMRPLDEAIAAL